LDLWLRPLGYSVLGVTGFGEESLSGQEVALVANAPPAAILSRAHQAVQLSQAFNFSTEALVIGQLCLIS
jgi:hypothetical protein